MPDLNQIHKYDTQNMLHLLNAFPEQCAQARRIAQDFRFTRRDSRPHTNVVIAGMGGSAIGGDLARAVLSRESAVPIIVNRNYTIPEFIGDQTLFIAASYSGNTEETLQSVHEAFKKGAEIFAITSGGRLREEAEANGWPCLTIPAGQPPRASLGYLFIPIVSILTRLGYAPDTILNADLDEAVGLLRRMAEQFKPGENSPPERCAKQLIGKLPIIYAPQELEAVAVRWKGQFSENSKSLAYANVYPEMNHNEIEGWKHPPNLTQKCHVIQLHDSSAPQQTQDRMRITAELICKHTDGITDVHSEGESLLARIFSLISIGDWTSFYLAIEYEQDPTPVDRIQELNEELKWRFEAVGRKT